MDTKILDFLPSAIWVSDVNGNRIYANEAFFKLFEIENSELNSWTNKIPLQFIKTINTTYLIKSKHKQPYTLKYEITKNSNLTIQIQEQANPIFDIDNIFVGYIGTCTNIQTETQTSHLHIAEKTALINQIQFTQHRTVHFLETASAMIKNTTNPKHLANLIDNSLLYFKNKSTSISNISIYKTLQEIILDNHYQLNESSNYTINETINCPDIKTSLPTEKFKSLFSEIYYLICKSQKNSITLFQYSIDSSNVRLSIESMNSNMETTIEDGTWYDLEIRLPILRDIFAKHGIDFEIEQFSTTNFKITTKIPQVTHQNKDSILVIDDDILTFKILKKILIEYKFDVVYAKDEYEALRIIHGKQQFHTAFIDINLPKSNGFYLADLLYNTCPSTQYIALTSYDIEEQIEDFMSSNFSNFISKPIKKHTIINAILEKNQND